MDEKSDKIGSNVVASMPNEVIVVTDDNLIADDFSSMDNKNENEEHSKTNFSMISDSSNDTENKSLVSGMALYQPSDSMVSDEEKIVTQLSVSNPESTERSNNPEKVEKQQEEAMLHVPLYDDEASPSDEVLESYLDIAIKERKLPKRITWDPLVDYARKRSVAYLLNEEYDMASKCDSVIVFIHQSLINECWLDECSRISEEFKKKLQFVHSKGESIIVKESAGIEKINAEHNEKLGSLKKKNEMDLESFVKKWSDPKSLLPFSKPSPQLLQFRKMQKSMALSRHFEKAKEYKAICEEMEKLEAIEATQKASRAMTIAYSALIEQQEKELSCLVDNTNRKIAKVKLRHEKELDVNTKLMKHIETKASSSKPPKKPYVTVPQVTSRENTSRALSNPGGITSRTRSQFQRFRQSTESVKLELTVLDVKSLLRPNSVSSSRVLPQ